MGKAVLAEDGANVSEFGGYQVVGGSQPTLNLSWDTLKLSLGVHTPGIYLARKSPRARGGTEAAQQISIYA